MTPFTVATLEAPGGGGKAAIGIDGSYYLLENIQPLLRRASCKMLLETRTCWLQSSTQTTWSQSEEIMPGI